MPAADYPFTAANLMFVTSKDGQRRAAMPFTDATFAQCFHGRMSWGNAAAIAKDGSEVVTAAGLPVADQLHPVQEAFLEYDGLQCGYCTPGQVCSAVGMLEDVEAGHASAVTDPGLDPDQRIELTDDEIRERMSGNLCRCGAYVNIVAAIREAARSGERADAR